MPISQTTITGSVKTPGNADAAITSVEFKLSKSDFEAGEVIAVNTVIATVVENDGDFSVTLWPNDRGVYGDSTYAMTFKFSDGSEVKNPAQVHVKHSDTPKTLEEVVFETVAAGKLKPYELKVLTQAQYAALNPKLPNVAYLVKP